MTSLLETQYVRGFRAWAYDAFEFIGFGTVVGAFLTLPFALVSVPVWLETLGAAVVGVVCIFVIIEIIKVVMDREVEA